MPHAALLLLALSVTTAPREARSRWDDGWVAELLAGRGGAIERVLADPAAHRLQILVTELRAAEGGGVPQLARHGFRVDAEYFYPASAIKTFAALTALEQLEAWRAEDWSELDESTPLVFHPLFGDEGLDDADASNLAGGTITIGHEVRKLFLVSDNRAFNRLLELVGRDELHERMWAAGFDSLRVRHRLSEHRTAQENRRFPRVELRGAERTLELPERESRLELDVAELPGLEAGQAYVGPDDARVDAPMSFREKNRVSLVDLQDSLMRLFGEQIPSAGARELRLAPRQLALLHEALHQLPRESQNPRYDPEHYPDEYVKFLLPGLRRVLPAERIRVWNKVGRAYGFSIENARVADLESGRAFYVTAVLYTNPNGVLNDGVYDYEALADPFLADLGQALAERLLRGE